MPQSLRSEMPVAPRKTLSASLEPGYASGNFLSDDEICSTFGREIERALELANLSKQDVQHLLKYANQSPVTKLVKPEQAPALAKLMQKSPAFKLAYILSLCETTPGISLQTTVTLERKRA